MSTESNTHLFRDRKVSLPFRLKPTKAMLYIIIKISRMKDWRIIEDARETEANNIKVFQFICQTSQ